MANEVILPAADAGRIGNGGSPYSRTLAIAGHVGSAAESFKGAFLFIGMAIPQGTVVSYAAVFYKADTKGAGGGQLRTKTYGIDEDNTSDFSTDPFGRPKTGNVSTRSAALGDFGDFFEIDGTDELTEVVSRAGWSVGNSFGVLIEDDGSDNDCFIRDPQFGDPDLETYIVYRLVEPDFTPAPKTVPAPALPAPANFGMKLAPEGTDVFAASDEELLLTTRKYQYKIVTQGLTSCFGGVQKDIAHGQDHIPQILCFARKNGKSFQLPRLFAGASDPVGGGVQGWVAVDSTNLSIYLTVDADVYYYIFLDEHAS